MHTLPSNSTGARLLARLQSMPGLNIRQHGEYLKMNSPLRPNSDSRDFKLTIKDDGEHGAWHDGPANKGGSLYELAQELGIEPGAPERAEAPTTTTKRAYTGLADYAQAHGVAADVFADAGWHETTHNGRPALRFPTASGDRWRYLDGDKPAYMNAHGYAATWYGLKRAIDMARRRGGPLCLCNGEASVVAAQHHGVPAAAITTGGERTLPEPLLAELLAAWDGPIAVALDCDSKGKEAAPKLAAQLRAAGRDAVAVDLGGSGGFDLADFTRLHEAESYAVLCELARRDKPRGKLIHNNELTKLPRPDYLIDGLLYRRAINVLYGAPGGGKSFHVLDCAAWVAQSENVVYVAAEAPGSYIERRNAWVAHNRRDIPGLYFWPEEVDACSLASVDAFIEEIAPLKPALVVFDTLAACIPTGDDSDASAVGQFLALCHRTIRECGAAAWAVHHTGKNGEYRGHSSLLGAADLFARFEDRDGLKVLSVEKNKQDKPIDPLRLRLLPVGESCVLIPDENFDVLRTTELTAQQMSIMEALTFKLFRERGASLAQLLTATPSATPKSLYSSLSVLLSKGHIEYTERGGNLRATDAGRMAFHRQYTRRPEPADDEREAVA